MGLRAAILAGLTGLTVAACQPASPPPVGAAPAAPTTAAVQVQASSRADVSDESRSAALYYARLQAKLQAQGLMRQDNGADIALDADALARNFERIALFSEYAQVGGRYVPRQTAAQLRRWDRPVRIQLHFGPSVPEATRSADRTRIAAYIGRMRRATGHPIQLVGSNGNYHIFMANVDELRALGPRIQAVEPGLAPATVRQITGLGRSTYCAVFASSEAQNPHSYVSAIAVIRAEHPDLFRLSCIHEEIAQGLGLANDSPAVRPSIFNDDEEFALLTRHDEFLLRILYDPRLRPGMTAEQARPIVRRIAGEIFGTGPA